MIDFRAVMITGARPSSSKVRFLWKEGRARVFDRKGFIGEFECTKPVRVRGHIGLHHAITDKGPIRLSHRCWTCGGHMHVARKKASKLWESADG